MRSVIFWKRIMRGFPLLFFFIYGISEYVRENAFTKSLGTLNQQPPIKRIVFNNICQHMENNVDEIQIHVIAWRRFQSFENLLSQLESSYYDGWEIPIPLYIHLDGGASREVTRLAQDFVWTHGGKNIDKRELNVGLREMWISSIGAAAKAAGNNTLLIIYEDDMIVSLGYFQWILAVIDAYGRNNRCRDSSLMGFSLSPIRLEELSKPFTRWNSCAALGYKHTAFLSVVPSSWGVAYWSDRWNEFSEFVEMRMQPPYYNAQEEILGEGEKYNYDTLKLTPKEFYIPGSRSNVWPKSWKRFMVDWMYARGLVMLYPSFPGEKGLATTLALPGEHVSISSVKNPRVADLVQNVDRELFKIVLAEYSTLPVTDLHLQPTTRLNLALEGEKFLFGVQSHCSSCEKLLRFWSRQTSALKEQPALCAPDIIMPSSSKFQNSSKDIKRYLLFEPQYGGNNQLFALIEALRYAKILGRWLVIPPLFLPRVSEFDLPYEDWPMTNKFFRVNDSHENISFQEWLKLGLPVYRKLSITRNAVFDKDSQILSDKIFGNTKSIPSLNLRQYFDSESVTTSLTPQDIYNLLGGCDDVVLAFEGMFFSNIRTGKDKWQELVDTIVPSDYTARILHDVKVKLQQYFAQEEYACYHVRAGDFVSMCQSTKQHGVDSESVFHKWKGLLEKQGFKCSVTTDEIISAIATLGFSAVILSNDNTMIIEGDSSIKELKILSSGWIHQSITEFSPAETSQVELDILSLIIEQELCADSKISILNKFSTVSKRIESMRKNNGKPTFHWSDNLNKRLKFAAKSD